MRMNISKLKQMLSNTSTNSNNTKLIRLISQPKLLGLAIQKKLSSILSIYEDLIGVSAVKESHAVLLKAEESFINSQEERRKAQASLSTIQEKAREIRYKLDHTPRGQENYLELIKSEIELLREERTSREIFEREEKSEREKFTQLSTALRASYEKERSQSEKTKPLFLIISVIGAMIGGSISALSSQSKIRQLKQLIIETNTINTASAYNNLEELITSVSELESERILDAIASLQTNNNTHQSHGVNNSNSDINGSNNSSNESLIEKHVTNICLISILSCVLYQLWSK